MRLQTVIFEGHALEQYFQRDAIALLGNTLATGAILFVLITVLGPISGAHMKAAVSLQPRGESFDGPTPPLTLVRSSCSGSWARGLRI
jgi:hypothetical protein